MKNRIIKIVLINFIFNSILFSNELKEIENIIEKSFINTQSKFLPEINNLTNNTNIKIVFKKEHGQDEYEDRKGKLISIKQNIYADIYINDIEKKEFYKQRMIPINGQEIISTFCTSSDNNIILTLMLSYGNTSNIYPWFVQFIPQVFEIDTKSNNIKYRKDIIKLLKIGEYDLDNIIIDDPNEINNVYPYYNKEKIQNKLYVNNICMESISKIKEEKSFFTKLLEFFNLTKLNQTKNIMQS